MFTVKSATFASPGRRSIRRSRMAIVALVVVASAGVVGFGTRAEATAFKSGSTYVSQFELAGSPGLGGGYSYRTVAGVRWFGELTPTYTSIATGFTHHQGKLVEKAISPAGTTECVGLYYSYRGPVTGATQMFLRIDLIRGPGPCASPIGTMVMVTLPEALPVATGPGYLAAAANTILTRPVGGVPTAAAWPSWKVVSNTKKDCPGVGSIAVPAGSIFTTVAPFVDDPRYLSALGQLSGGCSFEANRNVVPMSNPF